MFIPARSTLFVPAYALNHSGDPILDLFTYNPDRFLRVGHKLAPELAASPRYEERDHYTYGAGRRLCPGMHLAERTQWRVMAQLVWAFEIKPAIGPDGKDVEIDMTSNGYDERFNLTPKKYRVQFIPRSEKHAEIVRKEYSEVTELLKQWE